jgi:hypothetical protein
MSPVRSVSSGIGSIAAMKDDLTVWMWGRNTSAELATPQTGAGNEPCSSDTCILHPTQVTALPPLD